MTEEWSIAAFESGEEAQWFEFLRRSPNATLFHELDFLAYHPKGRFRFNHLMLRRNGELAAVLPGGLAGADGAATFRSPLGASVGGPAYSAKLSARQLLDMVEALRQHAIREGWQGVEITMPPAAYSSDGSETLAFSLFCRGFRLSRRVLCQMIPLEPNASDRYKDLFRATSANLVRAGRRKGVTTIEGGIELLEEFLVLFDDTYKRHGVAATHTPEEIADLMARLPDRVRIHLARADAAAVAGVLLFLINPRVASTFYICLSSAHAKLNANVVLLAEMLDQLAARGYRWLDLGPSASESHFNSGVVFFKEGLGSSGHCRDLWAWTATKGGT